MDCGGGQSGEGGEAEGVGREVNGWRVDRGVVLAAFANGYCDARPRESAN